ncbi:MAG: TraR/DksA C4-type zinc finger protein [Candidatus Sungbacteria bacterium]|nr:TraR/DksA C4-type zinc finger protein [Candidatus Sungbacteria bacterium]
MDLVTVHELKQALEKEHDMLVAELKEIARPDPKMRGNWIAKYPKFDREEYGSHSSLETEADEVEEYEERLEAEHSLESRLLSITHALHRIRGNTYGMCLNCKKEIPLERMRANPAAEFCMEHSPKN